MDFKQIIIDSVEKVVASGQIEAAVEARLSKAIKEVIDESLSSYSDFGQRIKEAVKASLALNGSLDLPSYNDAVLAIVRAQVTHQRQAIVEQQVVKHLEKILQPPPAEITLSELVDQFKEYCKERSSYGCHCESYGEVTVHVRDSKPVDGYYSVHLDDEPNKRSEECEFDLRLNREGELYALYVRHQGASNALWGGPMYGFHEKLFAMRVAGTRLVLDVADGELDTCYALAED